MSWQSPFDPKAIGMDAASKVDEEAILLNGDAASRDSNAENLPTDSPDEAVASLKCRLFHCRRRAFVATILLLLATMLFISVLRMPSSLRTSKHMPGAALELDATSFAQSFFMSTQGLQCWATRRNKVIQAFVAPIAWLQSLGFGQLRFLLRARESFGDNFCACGEVFLSSFENVTQALKSPQNRTYYLGEHPLIPDHLPDIPRSRNVFLLSLADRDAGGDGSHEAFRKAFVDYIMVGADARSNSSETDEVLKKLFDKLWLDFHRMSHEEFHNSPSQDDGLFSFLHGYLHYTMFGLDPFNETIMGTLAKLYFGDLPLTYYLQPVGFLFGSVRNDIEAVEQIYESSPALASFHGNLPEYSYMTKRELAALSATIMRMAGVTGVLRMAQIVTGYIQTGTGLSTGPTVFNHTKVLESINLDDDEELMKYMMECIRLNAVVSVSHHVANEEFSARMKDGDVQVFPKGTIVAIPVGLASLDPKFWGDDVLEFNMRRPGLIANTLGFNSVGGISNGRECPGKKLAMTMCMKLLRVLKQQTRPISG